jgi:hypothetical protein
MKTIEENAAALQNAINKIKNAEQAATSALVTQPRDLASGRFAKKPKLSPAQKSTQRLQNTLTKKDEAGKTVEDKLVEHLVDTALQCGPKDLMAAQKTYETLEARAWGRVAPSEAEVNANTAGPPIKTVYIAFANLPCQGELRPAEELRPHFDGEAPFIDAEVVEQNPRLTAEQMDPYKDLKKPEAPKAKPEPVPSVPCTCVEDSPMYCLAHRPN